MRSLLSASARVSPALVATLRLSIKRVVPAAGWASLDLHLHSYGSFDCPIAPADRVISAGGLGLDLMVFTDHNAVTGYTAQVTETGLPLVVAGQEVTTTGNLFGHFNVFPLDPRRPALRAWDTSPTQLFREAGNRGKLVLIQVNHPRMGSIGYFDQMQLDTRTDKARSAGYDPGFQLLELFNGDHIDHLDQVQRVMQDWFALLNAGRRYVATGGSDAHRLPYQDPGYPRTYVLWDSATPDSKTAPRTRPDAQTILKALAAGRAVVSTGPRVELTVDGQPVGSQVKLGPRGSVLRIRVQAAPWVDVRRVELWENGKPVQTLAVAPRRTVERLNHTRHIQPRHDSWYVVVVRGERPDPTQTRRVIPFAVTNPVWVDADGDGAFRGTGATGS